MNVQAAKLELIKLITEIDSEQVLAKIKRVITTQRKSSETDRILSNPAMVKRLEESRKQIREGKGVKVTLDDIWK